MFFQIPAVAIRSVLIVIQLQEQKKFQAIVKKLSKDATDAGYTFTIKYPSFDLMYDAGTKEAFLDVSKVDLQIAKIMYKG